MKNYETRLLDRYQIDINGTRKVRGGFLCDTKQGMLKLKELKGSAKKAPYVDYICKGLKESGFSYVDQAIVDKDGRYINSDREHGDFILKHWFVGRECDFRRDGELFAAARALGRLHRHLEEVSNQLILMQEDLEYDIRWEDFHGESLISEFERHNKELKKVRTFMRNKVRKGDFERMYLQEFNQVYKISEGVTRQLKKSGYNDLYNNALQNKQIIHGDYNYHNVLFVGSEVAITNLEKFKIDTYVADLYNFLRKVMEKRGWDVYLGGEIISAYEEERHLSDEECEYIQIRLSYPEKIWKIANYYYNTNKAWISEKSVEKLIISIEQMYEKQIFVERLFNNIICY